MNKLRESFFNYIDSWDKNILVSVRIDLDKFLVEDRQDCCESGRVISKNDLEGQQNHNFQEVQT